MILHLLPFLAPCCLRSQTIASPAQTSPASRKASTQKTCTQQADRQASRASQPLAPWALALLYLLLGSSLTACDLDSETVGSLDSNPPAIVQSPGQAPDQATASPDAQPEAPEVASVNLAAAASTSQASPPRADDVALRSPVNSPAQRGPFRVGNQTEHPLRIAFLAQGKPDEAIAKASEQIASTETAGLGSSGAGDNRDQRLQEPFHWDFAPGEGGRDGLLLALPQGDLNLQNGDVIVAFAQDGSQRYWGPYVVGQTPLPYWNGDRAEWQLLVQP